MDLKGIWYALVCSPVNGSLVPSPQTQILDPEFATDPIWAEMWFWGMIGRPDSSSPVQVALVSWLSIKVITVLASSHETVIFLPRMPGHDHSDHWNKRTPKW